MGSVAAGGSIGAAPYGLDGDAEGDALTGVGLGELWAVLAVEPQPVKTKPATRKSIAPLIIFFTSYTGSFVRSSST